MKWAETVDELLKNWEGIGKDLSEEDVDPEQLEMGIEIEMEHTKSREMSKLIALDHLYEDPNYYTKLKKMEASSDGK
jgi:hypothetical protein